MRTASIRDLHIKTSELVRDAANGEVIIIERRGEPVAELHPLKPKAAVPFPFEEMEKFWAKYPETVPGDSTDYISEDRNRML